MRKVCTSVLAIGTCLLFSTLTVARDTSRSVAGGGISVTGWSGKVGANEEKAGKTIADAKFAKEGDALHGTTGPATTYWNPANKASGDYTPKRPFMEPKFMNLNQHAHPHGICIAGTD